MPSGRGCGAATIATLVLSDWAFDHGAPRVQLLTIPGNTASEAVARRAGFRIAGREVRPRRGGRIEMLRWAKEAKRPQ
ncbi:GNAT family N-acetyltransferase [Amycolatopsis rhizosphaerae]|uniref:GNAT family N-acetyltransferase n=1 Tax=Amycolatopsis rhizosphaerae TaxID=2053003 RepID=UPI003CCC697A